jgi:hypothetical protein
MVLDWKKVAVILSVAAVFTALSIAGKLPHDGVVAGISAMLGWVGGLFTPTPKSKSIVVDANSDTVN